MKITLVAGCMVLLLAAFTSAAHNEREIGEGKVQNLSARNDETGQHPGTAEVAGPAQVVCTSAVSDVKTPSPKPSCNISGPGLPGNVNVGDKVLESGSGNIVLTCNGQGTVVTCSATITEQ